MTQEEFVEVLLPTLVSRKVGEGIWETVTFDLLRKGDVFRFVNGRYTKVYVATTDAEHCGPGECEYTIEAEHA